jgi:hypothetical protein
VKPAGEVVRSSDFLVQSVPTHGELLRFLRSHHYAKGGPNTSTYRHGMYRSDPALAPLVGELVGVTLWIPPTRIAAESVAGAEWQGVLTLSRLAIAPEVGTNGASFLLGRSMRLIDRQRWPWLLTYADANLGHTGAIYRATNWTDMGDTDAGDTWLTPDGQQVGRKRGGRTLLAAEMTTAGLIRSPKAKKRKFVHRVRHSSPPDPGRVASEATTRR